MTDFWSDLTGLFMATFPGVVIFGLPVALALWLIKKLVGLLKVNPRTKMLIFLLVSLCLTAPVLSPAFPVMIPVVMPNVLILWEFGFEWYGRLMTWTPLIIVFTFVLLIIYALALFAIARTYRILSPNQTLKPTP